MKFIKELFVLTPSCSRNDWLQKLMLKLDLVGLGRVIYIAKNTQQAVATS